ncbi:MFS transporter [Gordonia sp. LSe1-13]|uniref:MFS transporter n=1 Tax=Gordonia sesuvii TaxID=3116777 RepID=A0ABU7MJ20_9ACTN|nr:MFS transporter [Gordonia sp. LSe1-13]
MPRQDPARGRLITESAPQHPHPWRVFAATSTGVVAVFVSMSGLTVALPTLTRELGASAAQATWILLGYMVVTTALILVFGRLSDIVGRRPLYLCGLVVFTVATALCVFSPTAGWLIAARVLQGIGAAAVVTNNTSLLTDTFAPHLLGRALGSNATVAAVAQVLGPVVGGAATAVFGWRGLFLAVLPVAAAATVASLAVIPRMRPPASRREPFDVTGAILSCVLLTLVVLALTPGLTTAPWAPWAFWTAAAVTAAAFVVVQVRRRHPLVDLSLFRSRGIALVLLAALLIAVATYAVPLLISMFAQAVDGSSPFVAGLLVTPMALGTVIAAYAAGHLVNRFTPRALSSCGMGLTAVGLLATTAALSAGGGTAVVAVALSVIGCGIGLFMTPSTSALMLSVESDRRGIANGLRSTLQNVGNLLSTAIVLAVLTAGLDAAARQAAYAGTPGALTTSGIEDFLDNLVVAGLVLTGIAAVGVAVCLGFPRRTSDSPRPFTTTAPHGTDRPKETA